MSVDEIPSVGGDVVAHVWVEALAEGAATEAEQTAWSSEKVRYLDRIRELETAVTTRAKAQARGQPIDSSSLDPLQDLEAGG